MRRAPKIFLIKVIAVGGWTGVFVPQATATFDPPGPPALEDQVILTELIAKTDQDDGIFVSESEYCIRLNLTHPGHDEVKTEFVNCFSANWDAIDPNTGKPFDDPINTSGITNAGNMPLMGPGGLGGTQFEGPIHLECSPTAPWNLDIRLTESNSIELSDILKEIGKALNQKDLPVPEADLGRIRLIGKAAETVGSILDKLFSGIENLGISTPKWGSGEGDPQGVVPEEGDAFHFKFKAEKRVSEVPAKDFECIQDPPQCPIDEDHLFSKSVTVGAESWQILRDATKEIDGLAAESGEVVPPNAIDTQKQNLRELVAAIGHFVAQVELDEAIAATDKVSLDVLNEAQMLMAEGNFLRDQALASNDTQLLLDALDRYRQIFELLAPLLHPDPDEQCVEPSRINDFVTFNAMASTFKTVSNTIGCPSGFIGKFNFDARLMNKGNSPSLSDLLIRVINLSNGNLLQNADGGPGGIGAILTVPEKDGFSDRLLSAGEFVDIPFSICLKKKEPFNLSVDVLGIPQ